MSKRRDSDSRSERTRSGNRRADRGAKSSDRPHRRLAGLLIGLLSCVVAHLPGTADAQAQLPGGRLTLTPELRESLNRPGRNQANRAKKRLEMTPRLRRQLENLIREKESWTPVQRKIKPRLLMEYKRRMNLPRRVDRIPGRAVSVAPDRTTLVDIKGQVTSEVLRRIEEAGGTVINRHPRFNAIRARIPIDRVEAIASSPDIRKIQPAEEFMVRKINTSEGDVAHRADIARAESFSDGTGKKACVLSDSVEALPDLQASGDLPPDVEILPSQPGAGSSEGTALLEIIHDLAPGASLGFATADGGQANFAQNIIDLHAAGCDVIVDDVFYFGEPVFQDGVIAQAIDQVVADGALYFSSAGNGFNLNDVSEVVGVASSGVWEGDFYDSGVDIQLIDQRGNVTTYNTHDFDQGVSPDGPFQLNGILLDPPFRIILQWSERWGYASSDYDLHLVDLSGASPAIVASSMDIQNGRGDPIEEIFTPGNETGLYVLVTRRAGGFDRMLHLNTLRGVLGIGTSGQIGGHTGARGAIAVGAVDVATAGGGPFSGGAANPVEQFSSDGPRRVFFEADGTAITPGNFTSTGGELRQKPELAAADGVSTATPGFETFFGTSASAPHAAGIATLLLALPNSPSPSAVRDAMFNTALDIEAPGVDRDSGHGIVNAAAARALLYTPRPDLVAEWIKLKPTSCPGAQTPGIYYESAYGAFGDPDNQYQGLIITSYGWVGAEFTVTEPINITGVGAFFESTSVYHSGTLFGAIVALNQAGYPSDQPLTLDNVIASTVFAGPQVDGDYITPLSVTLNPGTYGLVFGSGFLGATNGFYLFGGVKEPVASYGRMFFGGMDPAWYERTFMPDVNFLRLLITAEGQGDVVAGPTECRVKGRFAIANTGPVNAVPSVGRLYYSPDTTTIPATDTLLAEFPVPALAPGQVQVSPVKMPLSGLVLFPPDARFYLQLDVSNAVDESDEGNNMTVNDGF